MGPVRVSLLGGDGAGIGPVRKGDNAANGVGDLPNDQYSSQNDTIRKTRDGVAELNSGQGSPAHESSSRDAKKASDDLLDRLSFLCVHLLSL